MLKSPLENMQNYIQSYMMAKESIGRINDIISFDDEISQGHLCLEKKISSIKVENVFHKFGNDYALQNINFEIGNAEKLGIFGGSGSGMIILGYFEPPVRVFGATVPEKGSHEFRCSRATFVPCL